MIMTTLYVLFFKDLRSVKGKAEVIEMTGESRQNIIPPETWLRLMKQILFIF